jgi:hypothetical protein
MTRPSALRRPEEFRFKTNRSFAHLVGITNGLAAKQQLICVLAPKTLIVRQTVASRKM